MDDVRIQTPRKDTPTPPTRRPATSSPSSSDTSQSTTLPKTLSPKTNSFFSELLRFTLIALIVVLPIRLFIAQPFVVSGSSMDVTFDDGDYLIVDELTYRFQDPERGDVAIFKFPHDPSKFFIKRIIGLPGETVKIEGPVVTIINNTYPEGLELYEPYVTHRGHNVLEITLDEGHYFVLGDNRLASSDSRSWGTLPQDFIVGRALVRLLPITHAATFPGKYDPEAPQPR